MPLPVNTTQHFAELLTLPEASFKQYLEAIQSIVQLRKGLVMPPLPAGEVAMPAPAPPVNMTAAPMAKALRAREPMRPPKAGSVRATVHEILRNHAGAMRRADIIKAVASARGVEVDPLLEAKVGDALSHRHDPLVRKVATGVYLLARDGKEQSVCL